MDFSDKATTAALDFSSQAAPVQTAAPAAVSQPKPPAQKADEESYLSRFTEGFEHAAHIIGLDRLGNPFVTIPRATANPNDSGLTATGKAVYNTGAGLAEFAESPLGVATAGAGSIPTMAKAAGALWAGKMLSDVPKSIEGVKQAYQGGNTQQQIEAGLNLVVNAAGGAGLAHEVVADGESVASRQQRPTSETPVPAGESEFAPDFSGQATEAAPPDFSDKAIATSAPGGTPSAAVETSGAGPTALPETKTDILAAPVQRVDAEAIATRPDLMQFKRMDDSDSGVNKEDTLAGKFDDLKAGNLLLWEPKDPAAYGLEDGQKYIVANGHHRFEFGEGQDVPSYNAQVIREQDGYSAQDARSLAAEINIADGKGTIYDATKYLRNESAAHGPDAALARAGSIGIKGRQASTIALQAGPDLYDSFVNERISPNATEAIAGAAPGATEQNLSLQRLGIRKAIAGAGPQEIKNLIQAVRLESGHMAPDQLDLFGANDSALQTAELLGKTASHIQGEVSREIRATDSAAKSATTAKAKGIRFERPPEEILAENERLKAERDRWDNWALHPDLVAQVRGYAEMARKQSGRDLTAAQPLAVKARPTADAAALPSTLDDKLQSLKIDTQGKMFDALQGIPVALWNAAVDVARLAVKGGAALGRAIEAAVQHIKGAMPGVDENAVRVEMAKRLGPAREFGQRVLGTTELSPDVKTGATEFLHEPHSDESNLQFAQRLVQAHGVDAAIELAKNDDAWRGRGDLQTAVGKTAMDAMASQEREARAKGDLQTASAIAAKQAGFIDWEMQRSTDAAQTLRSYQYYSYMTPAGMLLHARKTLADAGRKVMERWQPALNKVKGVVNGVHQAAVEAFANDPEVNRETKREVDGTIANSPEVRKAVIMELSGPWSQSESVVAQIRKIISEETPSKLRDLFQPEPPKGVPASQHLRVMIEDLGKRAAGIAAAHFQGAEPNVPLADKLRNRLGLSDAKAKQMAKQLDGEFNRQIMAALSKLPRKIANERVRKGTYNPLDVSDTAVDREIRRQLRDRQQKLGDLLRQFGSGQAAGKSLVDHVLDNAGLEHPEALRAVFTRRWNVLAEERRAAVIKQLTDGMTMRERSKFKPMWQRWTELSNLGALNDRAFYDAAREKLGLPVWNDKVAGEIAQRANDIQTKPEGWQRDRAVTDLLNHVENQKGVNLWDLPMAMWYSNVLSGVTTPAHILMDNIGSLAGNLAVTAVRDPGAMRDIPGALARGAASGAREAASTLRTGYSTGIKGAVVGSNFFERGGAKGPLKFLNAYKVVTRVLTAAHVATFKPAWELKSLVAARQIAREEGLGGKALRQRVADVLANTDQAKLAAKAQAATEGLTGLDARRRASELIEQQRETNAPGITDQARDYALRATYLNKPYGALGQAATAWQGFLRGLRDEDPALEIPARLAVPFTTIVSNIFNEKMNYTPVGAFRAWRSNATGKLYGQELAGQRLTLEQRDLYAKAIVGTLGAATLATFVPIAGNGPASPDARKQLEETGWRPNSIKVGDRYISYSRTPIAGLLGVIGGYQDAARYGTLSQMDALQAAMLGVKNFADQALHQSFLDGIDRIFEAVGSTDTKDGGDKLATWIAKQGSSFVVPNLLRQIDQWNDPTQYDASENEGTLLSQVPFLRREGEPVLNGLGEPVEKTPFGFDTQEASSDPVWTTLAAKQAWLPAVPKTVMVGKRNDPDSYRALTDDERYEYIRETGPEIRSQIESKLPVLQAMDNTSARATVAKIAEKVRREWLTEHQ